MAERKVPEDALAWVVGLLQAVGEGRLPVQEALLQVDPTVEDLGFAQVDHGRQERRGAAEVIFGPGKTVDQIAEIFVSLAARSPNVLCTRCPPEAHAAVVPSLPDARYDPLARLLTLHRDPEPTGVGEILVVSAGTSDQAVAREALVCARVLGNRAELLADVGVAGLHRLTRQRDRLREARVLIVVAGMEAALASVVAGLVARPVVAVPTSVGYGASFGGIAALLGILNSCSGGVTAVNIDNGFGAAFAASLMNRR